MASHSSLEDVSPEDRKRLPLLIEVLSRRTLAPVDLFSFYIYMRDQQRSVDYLDFWLDVSQHMSLCRHYVRELRRSMLYETPEFDKGAGSIRSSQLLDQLDLRNDNGEGRAPSIRTEKSQDHQVSAIIRADNGSKHSQKNSGDSNKSSGSTPQTPTERPRPSFMSSNLGLSNNSPESNNGQMDDTPEHTVNRADIRASAEKILYTFLLPGSEREIILPPQILADITEAIEEQGRDDPEVFDSAKEYVYLAMERDAYPGFLRSKALGNLVPPSMMFRLIAGLLSLFGAFWTSFILIFLDKSRATRCWIILPFLVGIYLLASHQYMLDPILGLAGYSEYTLTHYTAMREPYVRSLLAKRSLMVLAWIAIITTAFVCLFVFVPGHRL